MSGSTVCPVLHKMGFTGKKCKPLLCNNNSIHSGHFMSLLLHLSALCELMRLEVMPEVTSENLDTNYGAHTSASQDFSEEKRILAVSAVSTDGIMGLHLT